MYLEKGVLIMKILESQKKLSCNNNVIKLEGYRVDLVHFQMIFVLGSSHINLSIIIPFSLENIHTNMCS